jgi:two-component sensor histidine kinase
MSGDNNTQAPAGDDRSSMLSHKLMERIHQQEILAELGISALRGAGLDQMLQETTRLTAAGMRTEFCKLLEYLPSENRFVVRAGVGWGPGVVGVATIEADIQSPAGFALRTGQPVISNRLEDEHRFHTPELLKQYGIHRAMNVILHNGGRPYGVLEVDSRTDEEFVENDIAFLQNAANILGMAIERDRQDHNLRAAVARQEMLMREMNHRVKNSLSIVAAMLKLQTTSVKDPVLTRHLEEAAYRVSAVAKAHERIYQDDGGDRVDLGAYIARVCRDLDDSVFHCDIGIETDSGIDITIDRAIPIALIANELVTNAAKYAYPDGGQGRILVAVHRAGNGSIALSVADEGKGLPANFDPRAAAGLGMRIVQSFCAQLGARLAVRRLDPGAEFVVTVPIEPNP